MEGKVELTIDRYEELTALERNIKAKEKELDDLKRIAIDEGNVLTYKARWTEGNCVYSSSWEYKGKDKVIGDLVERLKSYDKKNRQLEQDLEEYTSACFSDRLCYLFLGRLPGMK
jgi:chromosome segregation ATPase